MIFTGRTSATTPADRPGLALAEKRLAEAEAGAGIGLRPNQYTTYGDWDAAVIRHRQDADGLITEALGWADNEDPDTGARRLDPETATGDQLRAWVREYLPRMRAWDESRPEWIR